jgi:hypothetical protein
MVALSAPAPDSTCAEATTTAEIDDKSIFVYRKRLNQYIVITVRRGEGLGTVLACVCSCMSSGSFSV